MATLISAYTPDESKKASISTTIRQLSRGKRSFSKRARPVRTISQDSTECGSDMEVRCPKGLLFEKHLVERHCFGWMLFLFIRDGAKIGFQVVCVDDHFREVTKMISLNLAIKQIVRACMMPSVLLLRSSTVTFTRMSHEM